MPSGLPRLIANTLERLVSTDSNRAQAFLAAAGQEAWRARFSDLAANWRLYPGISARASTVAAPAYGEVYSGLFVRPDAATYLTIDPGLAMTINPIGAGPDDSPYVFCEDPGISVAGVLPFVPNATALTVRWDVVECQPVDTLLESSSRDQYIPATGLFTPVVVDKVRAARMSYRYRQGTAGSGFPGGAAGWLPLAVVAVRVGAVSFAQCDFYDVRPLVSERVQPQPLGAIGNEGYSPIRGGYFQTSATLITGFSEAEFAGYLAGGALRNSVIPSTLAQFGLGAPANVSLGGDSPTLCYSNSDMQGPFGGGAQTFTHIVALFPLTPGQVPFPRWARYGETNDPALGRRVPNGPRGILVLTTTPPGPNGLYTPLSFPATMQLGLSGVGVCLGAIESASSGGVHTNRRYHHSITFSDVSGAAPWQIAATSTTADTATWELTPGVHYPPHAKSLRCSFRFDYNAGIAVNARVQVRSVDSNGNTFSTHYCIATNLGSGGTPSKFDLDEFDLAIPPLNNGAAVNDPYPPVAPSVVTWKVTLFFQAAFTFVDAFLHIHGWEF